MNNQNDTTEEKQPPSDPPTGQICGAAPHSPCFGIRAGAEDWLVLQDGNVFWAPSLGVAKAFCKIHGIHESRISLFEDGYYDTGDSAPSHSPVPRLRTTDNFDEIWKTSAMSDLMKKMDSLGRAGAMFDDSCGMMIEAHEELLNEWLGNRTLSQVTLEELESETRELFHRTPE